jgi:hypothetical protein
VGNIRIYVAGNSANGNGQNTGDRIFTANYTLTPATAQAARPAIRAEQPVLQAFSGTAGVSSGTWIEIYGTNLSPTTRVGGNDFSGNARRRSWMAWSERQWQARLRVTSARPRSMQAPMTTPPARCASRSPARTGPATGHRTEDQGLAGAVDDAAVQCGRGPIPGVVSDPDLCLAARA